MPILGSNALSQLLIVASTPLLTRAYDQSAFGAFGVATTLALIASTLLTLRLEHSLHVSSVGAARIYRCCLTLLLPVSLVMFALLLSLAGAFEHLLHTLSLAPSADALWIGVFATGHAIFMVNTIFLNFQQRFLTIACLNILVPVVFLLVALSGPAAPFNDANGLLVAQALAFGTGASAALWLHRTELGMERLRELVQVIHQERGNWQFLVPSQLLSIASLNLSVVAAAAMFDARMAGLILIAQRISRAPVTMVGNGLNEVLRAAIVYPERLKKTFNLIALLCSLAAIGMILTVALLPESMWSLVLGDGWNGLKPVLLITVITAGCQLIGTSVTSMLTAFDKRTDLQVNSALAVSGLLSVALAMVMNLSALTWLWLQATATGLVYLFSFVIARRVMQREVIERAQ